MYHYFYQEGHIPGLPQVFGAGHRIETNEANGQILSIVPFGSAQEALQDDELVADHITHQTQPLEAA